MAVLCVVVVMASLRHDRLEVGRERQALLASVRAHETVMQQALATAEDDRVAIEQISSGNTERLHDRFGRRLNEGFGLEFAYITDAKGNVLYSSERGQQGETSAYAWLRPAIERALEQGRQAARSGFVAGADGMAGLMVARAFQVRGEKLDVPQPLVAVTVDVVDADLLRELGVPASIENVQLTHGEDQPADRRTVFVPNLADGSEARLVWHAPERGRSLLRELMPIATLFFCLLAAIFLALMFRAQRMAQQLADSEARVRHLAMHDFLTGLPNRAAFLEELDAAIAGRADGETLALLFIDLDGFKEINDSAGHDAGDALLRATGERLRESLGEKGVAARLGGDEFVILTELATPDDLDALVARIYRLLEAPVQVGTESVRVGASMGGARVPQDATTPADLLRFADIALYRAKAEGRGVFRLFLPEYGREHAERRRLGTDLTAALAGNQLSLLYQPVVALETGRILAFEALARWDHATLGRLVPSAFMPAAEEARLAPTLDLHLLRRACIEARSLAPAGLSVNISPATLRSSGIVRRMLDVMADVGFDPRRLELELSEASVLLPSPEVLAGLEELRAAGVGLALDDFGTGSASVVHVRRFPITKIKIDKGFISLLGKDADAAAIVEYKVRVGRSLGLAVTAEGVETPEQLRFLRSIGMPEAQGYLFAPPLPLAAAVALLEREAEAGTLIPSTLGEPAVGLRIA